MFNKIEKPCLMFSMPDEIIEIVDVQQPDENGTVRLLRKPERLSDRSKIQMNPNIITLQSMIESGTLIEPKQIGSLLNITDFSDIECLNGQLSENMYQYLLDHKDELIPQKVENHEN